MAVKPVQTKCNESYCRAAAVLCNFPDAKLQDTHLLCNHIIMVFLVFESILSAKVQNIKNIYYICGHNYTFIFNPRKLYWYSKNRIENET